MANPVSFKNDILPMFSQDDVDHMKPMNVMLADYAFMSDPKSGKLGNAPEFKDHGNGRSCYAYLTGDAQPRMPMGGPYWQQDKLDTYNRWMADGFQP